MNQQSFSPFFEVIDDIKRLCEQGRTGTIFLVSDNNRMAQVFLENGNIASILCRGQRGQEALNSLSNMQSVRLRFDETIKTIPNRDGLSNQTVFEVLLKAAGKLSGISTNVATKITSTVAPTVPSPASFNINADTKKLVLETLTVYIGPFAEIVCEDHFEKANNLRGLIEQLAGEIPNETSANQFRSELLKKLKLSAN